MKRWCIIAACCGTICCLGATYLLLYDLPKRRINPANCDKITEGMTEAEVEGVLGSPTESKDRSQMNLFKAVRSGNGWRSPRIMKTSTWIGTDHVIEVDFGEKGTVEGRTGLHLEDWAGIRNVDIRSPLEKFWAWLKPEPDE